MKKKFLAPLELFTLAITMMATSCSSTPPKKVEQVQQPSRDPDSLAINQLQFFDFQVQYNPDEKQLTIDWTVNQDLSTGSFEVLYGKYCVACRVQEDIKVIGSVSALGKRGTERGLPAYRFVSYNKLKSGDTVFQLRYTDADGSVNSSYKVIKVDKEP